MAPFYLAGLHALGDGDGDARRREVAVLAVGVPLHLLGGDLPGAAAIYFPLVAGVSVGEEPVDIGSFDAVFGDHHAEFQHGLFLHQGTETGETVGAIFG